MKDKCIDNLWNKKVHVKICRLRKNEDDLYDIPLPEYKTYGSSGMDLYADIEDSVILNIGDIEVIPTGIAVQVPEGYEIQIRPRSGLAILHGITVINSPGTVDSDYVGEIKVGLVNLSQSPYRVNRRDRIAQMVLCPVTRMSLEEVSYEDFTKTERGAGGFGSTGR